MDITRRSLNIRLDTLIHLIITLEISLIVYLRYGNIFYILAALGGGVLIDADHLIDCFVYTGKINLKELIAFPYQSVKKVYLVFHSWELVVLGGFLAFLFTSLFWQIFIFSWGLHLFIDNIDGAKRKGFFSYFLVYRLLKKFKSQELKGLVFE